MLKADDMTQGWPSSLTHKCFTLLQYVDAEGHILVIDALVDTHNHGMTYCIPTRGNFYISRVNGYSEIHETELHRLIRLFAGLCHNNGKYFFNHLYNAASTYTTNWRNLYGIPYPEPVYTGWSSVHWNATGMPLVDPVYTGIPLGHPANNCRVHWNTTGKT